MRLPILLLSVVTATLLAEPRATLALDAYASPWCSVETGGTGPGGRKTCAYDSWEQCMARSPGIGGLCIQNSLYGARAPALYYRRSSAHKHKHKASS
jgi:hypothetical protein